MESKCASLLLLLLITASYIKSSRTHYIFDNENIDNSQGDNTEHNVTVDCGDKTVLTKTVNMT